MATYQADPAGAVPVGFASVVRVKINRGTLSFWYGCARLNASRSDPGGAGVGVRLTMVTLVSPAGSASFVSPGITHALSGGGGSFTVRSISLLLVPTPTLLIALT